jgi:DedD protein
MQQVKEGMPNATEVAQVALATPSKPVEVKKPQVKTAVKAAPKVPEAISNSTNLISESISKPVEIKQEVAAPAEVQQVKPEIKPSPVEIKPEAKSAPVEMKPAPVEVKPEAKPTPVEVKPEVKPAPVENKPEAKLVPVEVKPAPIEAKPEVKPSPSDAQPSAKPEDQEIHVPFSEEVAEKALHAIQVFNPKHPQTLTQSMV